MLLLQANWFKVELLMYFAVGRVKIEDPGIYSRDTLPAILQPIVITIGVVHGGIGRDAGKLHTGNF